MRDFLLKCYVGMRAFRDLLMADDGQDMVEYAIVVGLIALGATVAMNGLAATIANAFTSVSNNVTTYTS